MANPDVKVKISAEDATRDAFRKVQSGLRDIQSSAVSAVGALSALGVGISLAGLVASFKGATDELIAMGDLAEATGSSVETISAALNQLRATAEGDLSTLSDLAQRFGRSLASVDKDTSRAAEAYRKLGLNIDDLKSMGRIDAVLAIARAQEQYANTAEKSIVVDAALGRGASELISTLNALAGTTSEMSTATAEQAKQAKAAQLQFAALQAQVIAFRNDIVTAVLPSFNELLIKLRAFATIGSAPKDLLSAAFGDAGDLQRTINERTLQIAKLQQQQDVLLGRRESTGENSPARRSIDAQLDTINSELQAAGLRLNQLRALRQARSDIERGVNLAAVAATQPTVNADGLSGAVGAVREARDAYKELDALIRQADTDDELKRQAEAAKELAAQLGRAADAALRRIAETDRAESDADEALASEIERTRDLVDATRALYRERERLADLEAAGLSPDDAAARRAQLNQQIAEIYGGRLPKQTQEATDAAREFGLTFSSALEDAIIQGRELSDVLKGLAQDIARAGLRKLVTEPLLNAVSGGLSGIFGGGAGAANGQWDVLPPAVAPTAVKGGGGGVTIYNTFAAGTTQQDVANAAAISMAQAKQQIASSIVRRGEFYRLSGA